MKNYKELKNKLLRDKEVKKSYEELKLEFEFIVAIIEKRIEKGLTQKMLAEKLGTKQSAISRLESGLYNPSFAFLKKTANAMNLELKISLAEKQ